MVVNIVGAAMIGLLGGFHDVPLRDVVLLTAIWSCLCLLAKRGRE